MREKLSRDDVEVRTVVGCFLIQEGADMNSPGFMGLTLSQALAIGESAHPWIKATRAFADEHVG